MQFRGNNKERWKIINKLTESEQEESIKKITLGDGVMVEEPGLIRNEIKKYSYLVGVCRGG